MIRIGLDSDEYIICAKVTDDAGSPDGRFGWKVYTTLRTRSVMGLKTRSKATDELRRELYRLAVAS